MKKWLSHIIFITIACLCYSCSGDEDLTGPGFNGHGEGIVIRLGITSRADGQSNITGVDNKEITNLKVWMVNEENDTFSFYKEISDDNGINFNENDIYSFEMEISLLKPGKYGFYILANSNNISGITFDKNTKPSDLQTAYFTAISGGENAQAAIPMYGEYHSVEILSGVVDYYVRVPITRVLAKLEMFFAKDNNKSDLLINSLSLTKVPDKGYLVPRELKNELTYTNSTTLMTSAEGEKITASSPDFHGDFQEVEIVHPFFFENPNGGEKAIPEAKDDNSYQLSINYTLQGKQETQMVSLPKIERNNIYKIYARILDKGEKLALKLEVKPWDLIETELNFTDIITYSVSGWVDGTYKAPVTPDHKVYMKLETPAQFRFKIETPEDCQYKVALTNNSDFTKTVEEASDGTVVVSITAKNTNERHSTALCVYAITRDGRSIELDVTEGGNHTSGKDGNIKRYNIIQDWK